MPCATTCAPRWRRTPPNGTSRTASRLAALGTPPPSAALSIAGRLTLGPLLGGAFVVLGMGKLGSHELTVGSDLDLVFVYDAPRGAESDGARPLEAATYYARLGQRLVSNLAANTAEGQLYEIDTRLRPSGNVGPVATSLASFTSYHAAAAQIWEQQALTRARVVAGDTALGARVEDGIWENLARPRAAAELGPAIAAMRERVFKEHGSADPWNLKHAPGGMVELEFTVQYLKLLHSAGQPRLRATGMRELLAVIREEGLLPLEQAQSLERGFALHQAFAGKRCVVGHLLHRVGRLIFILRGAGPPGHHPPAHGVPALQIAAGPIAFAPPVLSGALHPAAGARCCRACGIIVRIRPQKWRSATSS